MFDFIRNLRRGLSATRRHTLSLNELSKLDDHLLKDMGVDRPRIPSFGNALEARQTF